LGFRAWHAVAAFVQTIFHAKSSSAIASGVLDPSTPNLTRMQVLLAIVCGDNDVIGDDNHVVGGNDHIVVMLMTTALVSSFHLLSRLFAENCRFYP
jgi:hypothetical protein